MPQFDDSIHAKKLAELYHKEEEELIRVLSQKYGHQYIDLRGITINSEALRLVAEETARMAEVAAFEKSGKKISVAIKNPNNPKTQEVLDIFRSRGFGVTIFMASTQSLRHAWERYEDIRAASVSKRGVLDIVPEEIERLAKTIKRAKDVKSHVDAAATSKNPRRVSEIIETILGGALALSASDVHIEPEDAGIRLRYRIHGALWDITDLTKEMYEFIRQRFKLVSGLKLNVTDEAQDGRYTIDISDKELEIRTSVIPGAFGESIVMRILDPTTIGFTMEKLGIDQELYDVIKEEIGRPNGMILTTGPTGSGKTTSLYAFMRQINRPEVKIVTIEDPVEYHLDGIVQTQVGDDYSFASGLRAILRQDPDIIMVGEIRDSEVAETAVHASLTGHLVFSTLHTNSAVGSFPRLIDLGVDSRMMGSAINLAMAQRLVRSLCEHCKKEREPTPEEAALLKQLIKGLINEDEYTKNMRVWDAVGCEQCDGSGYGVRVGIYEGIRVDTAVENAIINDPRESNILAAAAPQGIPTMQQDGARKVLRGVTSLEELGHMIDLHNFSVAAAADRAQEKEDVD